MWVDLCVNAIRDASCEPIVGYVAVLRDTSAQVAAEDALRLSEQRLAFALDSGGDGVWSYDCERDHVVLAGRWWSILGYEEGEIEPTFAGWHALTHPDDQHRVREVMLDHLKGRSASIAIEYRIRTKSGSLCVDTCSRKSCEQGQVRQSQVAHWYSHGHFLPQGSRAGHCSSGAA